MANERKKEKTAGNLVIYFKDLAHYYKPYGYGDWIAVNYYLLLENEAD